MIRDKQSLYFWMQFIGESLFLPVCVGICFHAILNECYFYISEAKLFQVQVVLMKINGSDAIYTSALQDNASTLYKDISSSFKSAVRK